MEELPAFDAVRFGRRIASRRKKSKIKQTELAERVGISQQHMSGIERGKGGISFEVFIKLCIALNVNSDYLLGGTLRASNIPKGVVDGLNQCTEEDQTLAADIIELFKKKKSP